MDTTGKVKVYQGGRACGVGAGRHKREKRKTETAVTKTPQYTFSHDRRPLASGSIWRRSHGNIHALTAPHHPMLTNMPGKGIMQILVALQARGFQ